MLTLVLCILCNCVPRGKQLFAIICRIGNSK